ncbi:MAG: hypothetical protein K8U03_00020 [Planctomycetia bacterium]|nr:hypothetical protein [Planctomycetia bacterium]
MLSSNSTLRRLWLAASGCLLLASVVAHAQQAEKKPVVKAAASKPAASKVAASKLKQMKDVPYPPTLPGGVSSVTETSADFLKRPESMSSEVETATTPPTVDFAYYPGQNYLGDPWSNWGDSIAVGDKYYASIGDHASPTGNAFIYEYDPAAKTFRKIFEVKETLKVPEGKYAPGKIHSRLDLGSDGKIYFSTHRGSPKTAADAYDYRGDCIFRTDPKTGTTEIVVEGAVAKHSIPTSVLDPERLIFYGGTAHGVDAPAKGIQFVAYDCKNNKLLQTNGDGPPRYLLFAKSTGCVYYVPASNDAGRLVRFDPKVGGAPVAIDAVLGVRAATQETPQGKIYTASTGQGKGDAMLWSFDVKTEKVEQLGNGAVGSQAYIASMDADPTGRYVYYVPGAHGGSEQDGSAVVQFDTETRRKKVIAFLNPVFQGKYGVSLKGTYSTALDPKGEKLFITWNASRETTPWDCCALTVVHIPASERKP